MGKPRSKTPGARRAWRKRMCREEAGMAWMDCRAEGEDTGRCGTVQRQVFDRCMAATVGLMGVHAVMLLVLAALFYRRLVVFSLFRLVR